MSNPTSALLRCVAAGAPLPELRAATWTVRVDDWGRRHPRRCSEVPQDAPSVEITFEDLLADAYVDADANNVDVNRPTDPTLGRAPVRRCHTAAAIEGVQRLYVRELDARVRPLLEARGWVAKGQVPFAVTARARVLQDERLGRLPQLADLPVADLAWLERYTAEVDDALDGALATLPGTSRTAQLTTLLTALACAGEAARAYPWTRFASRNAVGVVAREALALTLSSTSYEDKAMTIRLQGRGAPRPHGLAALKDAIVAINDHLASPRDLAPANGPGAADSSVTGAAGERDTGSDHEGGTGSGRRLAAFTVGANLDIPKDGLAGLAVAAIWLGARDLYTSGDLGATPFPAGQVDGSAGSGRPAARTAGRGVAVVAPDLAAAASRVAALDHATRNAGSWLSNNSFDVVDAGAWQAAPGQYDTHVLATMMRLWQAATHGPLANAEHALDAALAVHA